MEELPTCPTCETLLKAGKRGELDFWSCPAGHGLGFTMSELYGRVEKGEISQIWRASQNAPAGKRPCAWCDKPMLTVTVPVDAGTLALDVCRDDQFFWFDPGELDALPADKPEQPPTADEQRKIDLVLSTFDHDLAEASHEDDRSILDRLADSVARHHPGFAQLLDHAVYGDALDRLEAETEAEEHELAESWQHGGHTTAA